MLEHIPVPILRDGFFIKIELYQCNDQLKQKALEEFPEAMKCKRPGFDVLKELIDNTD